jgi:regulator of protease activity HflC (stomatin/prohibitin superfamily)
VVGLRRRRATREITALTRDGIPVSCEVDIRYQIRHKQEEAPTPKRPFPASHRHVLRAATSTWKCDPFISEDGELDWEDRLTFAPLGILRSIFARYSLDQLIQPVGWEGDDPLYRERMRDELEQGLHVAASGLGAEVLGVHLGDVEIRDDGVTKQWLEAWRVKWESQLARRRAEGAAEAAEQIGTARAEAQAEMVVTLTRSLQALASSGTALQSRLGLLRVVAILRSMARDPMTEPFLPVEALHDLIALQQKVEGLGEHPG